MEKNEIDFEVTKLMQELQQNEIVIETLSRPYLRLKEMIDINIEELSKVQREKSKVLQDKITELMLLKGESFKTSSGNITYRKGATRRSWDLDKLDETCNSDETIKVKIWDFRKENNRRTVCNN